MIHAHCMKTVMGGLSLVLILSACSSGSKKATASVPPGDLPRSDVVTDRGTTRGTLSDPTDKARLSDRSPEIAAACPSRTDAQGNVVFEDPSCPDRYRSQLGSTNEKDGAGLAAACSSRVDASGKVIYDDPACPDRYRRQAGTTAESSAAGLAAACSSRVDDAGKVVYDDPACPDRYRRQTAGANDPAVALVDANCPSKVDPNGKVIYADATCAERYRYQTKENAFYDRYADKAAKHARAAEIAGNQGNVPDMIQNAEVSLDHAKEARRSGNNPDLAAGIAALRQSIALGQINQVPDARSSIREARVRLSRAAGIKVWDTAATPGAASRTQTIKGELLRNEKSARVGGGEDYIVRDSQHREMPIALSPEMSRQVQVGDVVEAQVDSSGQVTSISKSQ
jgi:Small metal-binding protein